MSASAIESLKQAEDVLKLGDAPREIDRNIIDEVDAKVRCIKRPAGVSIRSALVYEGRLAPIVEADGYFDALVQIEKLLGLPSNP